MKAEARILAFEQELGFINTPIFSNMKYHLLWISAHCAAIGLCLFPKNTATQQNTIAKIILNNGIIVETAGIELASDQAIR